MKISLCALFLVAAAGVRAQRTVHVMTALCDNKYQGIVKVPSAIGNGQKPAANLYWGCAYGIKTFFGKSSEWKRVASVAGFPDRDSVVLERIVFRHRSGQWHLVADAYNGKHIKQCTTDFLKACAGTSSISIEAGGVKLPSAEVAVYVGHNGLMDFSLSTGVASGNPADSGSSGASGGSGGSKRRAIVLACASRQYFTPYIKASGAGPLLWTTNLMCPEAYTLHDALSAYIAGGDDRAVHSAAAAAYAKYQKCSVAAARKLIVTGYSDNRFMESVALIKNLFR
ncbi:MAG: hypothetical protein LBH06_02425 [Rikenellaceae bacterium]|nr:hypothetical protein [Rikenellaceae bacterium]